MDKTTTWLIRGAALVVISSGVIALLSFLKPNLINFGKEEREKIAIEKAKERCKNPLFHQIGYGGFEYLYLEDLITKVIMYENLPMQIETTETVFGTKHITDFSPDEDFLALLAKKNIPVKVGINLMCK